MSPQPYAASATVGDGYQHGVGSAEACQRNRRDCKRPLEYKSESELLNVPLLALELRHRMTSIKNPVLNELTSND